MYFSVISIYLLSFKNSDGKISIAAKFYFLINLFGYFYTNLFITSVTYTALSGLFATWYYAEDKKALLSSEMTKNIMEVTS